MLKEIMKRAHRLAKKMIGDYQARLVLALRIAWKEVKTSEEGSIGKKKESENYLKNLPYQLYVNIENAKNDGEEITKEFAVKEAEYLLECYQEEGHTLYEEDDKKSEMRKLKKYIKKFK